MLSIKAESLPLRIGRAAVVIAAEILKGESATHGEVNPQRVEGDVLKEAMRMLHEEMNATHYRRVWVMEGYMAFLAFYNLGGFGEDMARADKNCMVLYRYLIWNGSEWRVAKGSEIPDTWQEPI